jgi:hypothetical protein
MTILVICQTSHLLSFALRSYQLSQEVKRRWVLGGPDLAVHPSCKEDRRASQPSSRRIHHLLLFETFFFGDFLPSVAGGVYTAAGNAANAQDAPGRLAGGLPIPTTAMHNWGPLRVTAAVATALI